jgi:hypothetical protein
MKVERSRSVFGFEVTVRVSWPESIAALSPGMLARLEHHVERSTEVVGGRVVRHVIEWPARRKILRRLTCGEAVTLGLKHEWQAAHAEGSE